MALPKISELPQYECEIPSTKQKIKFRPFLVKEQKVLLMALESKDPKEMARSILNVINSCFIDVKINNLTTFDVDFLFANLRAKSVGEKSEFNARCASCEEYNTVSMRLDELKIEVEGELNKERIIKLNDGISIVLKYPSYEDIMNNEYLNLKDATSSDAIFETILLCINSVLTEDEKIIFKDESHKDQIDFLESLTSDQFKDIMQFVNNMPKLTHSLHFKCEKCGADNENIIQGLENFF